MSKGRERTLRSTPLKMRLGPVQNGRSDGEFLLAPGPRNLVIYLLQYRLVCCCGCGSRAGRSGAPMPFESFRENIGHGTPRMHCSAIIQMKVVEESL